MYTELSKHKVHVKENLHKAVLSLSAQYSPVADAEVISAAMEAVLAVGIEEFSMEIGQIAFFNGLVKQQDFDEQSIEKLRERIDSKDSVGIKTITDNLILMTYQKSYD